MSIPDIVRGALTGAAATAFLLGALRFVEIWEAPVSPWTLAAVALALFLGGLLVPAGEPDAMDADARSTGENTSTGGHAATPDPLAASLADAAQALSSRGTSDLGTLLATMDPVLLEHEYVYLTVPDDRGEWHEALQSATPLGTFEEEEGMTWIVQRNVADAADLTYDAVFRGITLSVHSSLTAVGFLSVLTFALSEHGVAVNVVSAAYHDHLFVPKEYTREAMAILNGLQASGAEARQPGAEPSGAEPSGAPGAEQRGAAPSEENTSSAEEA